MQTEIHKQKVQLNLKISELITICNYMISLQNAIPDITDNKLKLSYMDLLDHEIDSCIPLLKETRSLLSTWFEIEKTNQLPVDLDLRKFYSQLAKIKV